MGVTRQKGGASFGGFQSGGNICGERVTSKRGLASQGRGQDPWEGDTFSGGRLDLQ